MLVKRVITMLPNVVYVGMGKSGSTLLHKLFLRHPDIYVSKKVKEINFFAKDMNWSKGLSWYEDMFDGYRNERWVVDISPGYHNKVKSIARMKTVLGDEVKIIFTFRRFTDFAFSRYLHRIRGKRLRGGFLELLEQKSMFIKPLDELVGQYIDAFGSENVLIMHYENEFKRSSPTFEERIYEFLGLPTSDSYYETTEDVTVNSGFYPRFVHADGKPYEEEYDGVAYRVPANTLVFCSGRTYKNVCWTEDVKQEAVQARALQNSWTTCLDEEAYSYVQEKYTIPLAQRLEDRLGISFEHWHVTAPKRLEYRASPLPDHYICDDKLRAERMSANKIYTPWT